MSEETWDSPPQEKPGDSDREEDWGESGPVKPIREEPLPAPPRPAADILTGIVRSFDPATGYGFLEGGKRQGRVFVAAADLAGAGVTRLYKDQEVTFRVTQDRDGRSKAAIVAAKLPYVVRSVFFATDRRPTEDTDPGRSFANEFGDKLRFGVAEVAIPFSHEIGQLESPSVWRLEFHADPRRHVTLLSAERCDERQFLRRVGAELDRSLERQALIFVHGFNVAFGSCLRRTAQLAHDLKIDGPAIAYSWSSHASASLRSYAADGTNNERTVPFLEEFLENVAVNSGARAIYLVAHSMGNRALTHALDRLASRRAPGTAALFREAILAAPDIDKTVFAELAKRFRGTARRFTIYASRNDFALNAAKFFHGYPRAGDASDGITIVDGMDSVDASTVDTSFLGHSYYGNRRSVLDDIFEVVSTQLPADRRFNLASVDGPTGRFWRFRS